MSQDGQRAAMAPAPSTSPVDSTTTGPAGTPIDTVMTIYVGGGNSLFAVNAQTGAVEWSTSLGDIVVNSPLYYQGMIYIATGALTSGTLHALDTSGKEQWSVILGTGLGMTPNDVYATGGLVYVCIGFMPPVVSLALYLVLA